MAKVKLNRPPAGFKVSHGQMTIHRRTGETQRERVDKDATEFDLDFGDQETVLMEFRWVDEQGRESPPTTGTQFNKSGEAVEQKGDQLGFQP